MTARTAAARLRDVASPAVAKASASFFKTGPGEYGEGDVFLGVRVPMVRSIAKEFRELALPAIRTLLQSPIHEERLLALLILVQRATTDDHDQHRAVYDFYIEHRQFVNNWDLVDTSAPAIVGGYLLHRSRRPLYRLAAARSLWDRRIALLATLYFIRQGDFTDTLQLCRELLTDDEDLIHKAAGWMLREVGKRDRPVLAQFLEAHAPAMPRTMLRYALEHFPADQRRRFLAAAPPSSPAT